MFAEFRKTMAWPARCFASRTRGNCSGACGVGDELCELCTEGAGAGVLLRAAGEWAAAGVKMGGRDSSSCGKENGCALARSS